MRSAMLVKPGSLLRTFLPREFADIFMLHSTMVNSLEVPSVFKISMNVNLHSCLFLQKLRALRLHAVWHVSFYP